jgi:hypothetical protein
LGSWACRSGNSVDVFFTRSARGLASVVFEWDTPPPLSAADHRDYEERVLPDVIRRVQEYTETRGPALVITA